MVVLVFAFFPTTFFFRMAYSESVFLFFSILAFYGMDRRWRLWQIAVLVGFATATRPVGVVLILPLVVDIYRRAQRPWLAGLWLMPLACWGLMAFMAYQWLEFGDALAFARTQADWHRRPPVPLITKVFDLTTMEPMRAVFDSDSPCWWGWDGVGPVGKERFFQPSPCKPVLLVVRSGSRGHRFLEKDAKLRRGRFFAWAAANSLLFESTRNVYVRDGPIRWGRVSGIYRSGTRHAPDAVGCRNRIACVRRVSFWRLYGFVRCGFSLFLIGESAMGTSGKACHWCKRCQRLQEKGVEFVSNCSCRRHKTCSNSKEESSPPCLDRIPPGNSDVPT